MVGLQVSTQPLWLLLLVVPYVYVFDAHPTLLDDLRSYAGEKGQGGSFDPLLFGSALWTCKRSFVRRSSAGSL